MKPRVRVLVTAVGGDLGQSIVKSLLLSSHPISIYGCDVDPSSAGRFFVESHHRVPGAAAANYVSELEKLVRDLSLDAVIPASEAEILRLSRLGGSPQLTGGVPIVCQPRDVIARYGDKLECMRALERVVPVPRYADGTDRVAVQEVIDASGFPLVVKPRHSSGSRDVFIVKSISELDCVLRWVPKPFVQEFLSGSRGEFSAGIFVSEDFRESVVFRRKLGPGGASWLAQLSQDEDVTALVQRVTSTLDLRGSVNLQMRKGHDRVGILELNPRISSLAAARALSGFLDVEWSLMQRLGINVSLPTEFRDLTFQRLVSEVVDRGTGYELVREWSVDVGDGEIESPSSG